MKTLKNVWLLLLAWGAIASQSFATYYVDTGKAPAMGSSDGPNLYAYVQQNPWTKFDPEGLTEDRQDNTPHYLNQNDQSAKSPLPNVLGPLGRLALKVAMGLGGAIDKTIGPEIKMVQHNGDLDSLKEVGNQATGPVMLVQDLDQNPDGVKKNIEDGVKNLGTVQGATQAVATVGIALATGKVAVEMQAATDINAETKAATVAVTPSASANPALGSLTNIQARDWYNAQVSDIAKVEADMREQGKSAEEIFNVTTKMRNDAKLHARALMKDQSLAKSLPPPQTPEATLQKYGGDHEAAIEAAKRTNADVNKEIENKRASGEQ